jgi:hypothetical protein
VLDAPKNFQSQDFSRGVSGREKDENKNQKYKSMVAGRQMMMREPIDRDLSKKRAIVRALAVDLVKNRRCRRGGAVRPSSASLPREE